jgi:hypothetical protein
MSPPMDHSRAHSGGNYSHLDLVRKRPDYKPKHTPIVLSRGGYRRRTSAVRGQGGSSNSPLCHTILLSIVNPRVYHNSVMHTGSDSNK